MRKKTAIASLLVLFGVACVPPSEAPVEEKIDYAARENECNKYISFAYTNYQNRDFEGVIRNYNQALSNGCGEGHASDIYQWMGRAYIEMGKLDSAAFIISKGVQYLPEDTPLLMVGGWTAGKLGNLDDEIYYYDKILSYDPENTEVMQLLSDIYGKNKMYKEQIVILNMWQKIEPDNSDVLGELKNASSKLGLDVLDIDKHRWEKDPGNIQYGLEYVDGLIGADRYTEAIDVLNELLYHDQNNKQVLKLLSESYLNAGKADDAEKSYKRLYRLDKSDISIPIALTEIFINKDDYATALEWAEKAVTNSAGNGVSYYHRAEVYFSCADYCQRQREKSELKFMDKVVYEMAYEDYKEAVARGYLPAKTRRDFLKENYITTKADWFMRPADEYDVSPDGDCYGWIKRSIKRK